MVTGTSQIIRANSRALPIADDSVDLIVTSPPYFALRSYQDGGQHYDGQIGDEPTPAEFVDSLLEVTRECVRVLKPSGSLWVNLGDSYSRGARPIAQPQQSVHKDRPRTTLIARAGTGHGKTKGGIPAKSLSGIPWRYALRCIDDLGLILRAEVIWSKPNGLPESVTDRVRRSHETWFHFTLNPRYFSAVDEIREEHVGGSGGRGDYANKAGAAWEGKRSASHVTLHSTEGNPLGKLPGSVWTVPTQPLRVPEHLGVDHFAAFPMEWPRRIIQGWSPSGVCVECGEGLRPITTKDGGRPVARAHRHLPGYSDPAGEGMRDQSYRIEGYECSCHHWTPQLTASARTTAPSTPTTRALTPAAAAAEPGRDCTPDATARTSPGVRPAVVLDPFGGTGTTALVAKALGRHGISVDMSADYCRLAEWRTNDEGELARALQVEKPTKQIDGQGSLLDFIGEATA